MIKTSLYGLMSALTGALDMMSPQLAATTGRLLISC